MRTRSKITALLLSLFSFFSPVFAPPAYAGDGPIDTGVPCVPPSRYTQTDSIIFHTGLKWETFKGSAWDSFNCFYYIMTWILGELPPDMLNTPSKIREAEFGLAPIVAWDTHKVPGNAFFKRQLLEQHGYHWQFATTSLAEGPVGVPKGNRYQRQGFRSGDIILVFNSSNPFGRVVMNIFVHVAIVTQTDGNGHIITTRQKINPWTCVQDLAPDRFDVVYGGKGMYYEVFRQNGPAQQPQPSQNQPPPNAGDHEHCQRLVAAQGPCPGNPSVADQSDVTLRHSCTFCWRYATNPGEKNEWVGLIDPWDPNDFDNTQCNGPLPPGAKAYTIQKLPQLQAWTGPGIQGQPRPEQMPRDLPAGCYQVGPNMLCQFDTTARFCQN